jgi:hypothetical protein
MAHPRIAIIDAVLSILRTADVLGDGVSDDRYYREYPREFPLSALPALNVLVQSDEIGWGGDDRFHNLATGELYRALTFTVTVCVLPDLSEESAMNTLHNIVRAAEAAILVDRNLTGTCEWVLLGDTSFDYDRDEEDPAAIATIAFEARYLDRPASDA